MSSIERDPLTGDLTWRMCGAMCHVLPSHPDGGGTYLVIIRRNKTEVITPAHGLCAAVRIANYRAVRGSKPRER